MSPVCNQPSVIASDVASGLFRYPLITWEPLTHSSPISPSGTASPSSLKHRASKHGIAGPALSGLSRKKSAEMAVIIPQVSVIP